MPRAYGSFAYFCVRRIIPRHICRSWRFLCYAAVACLRGSLGMGCRHRSRTWQFRRTHRAVLASGRVNKYPEHDMDIYPCRRIRIAGLRHRSDRSHRQPGVALSSFGIHGARPVPCRMLHIAVHRHICGHCGCTYALGCGNRIGKRK